MRFFAKSLTLSIAGSAADWVATPWTAVHQWTTLAANITVLRRPDDDVGNQTIGWKILHLTDAHISLGEALELHQTGTRRMHAAFRSVLDKHLDPGMRRSPAETFRKLLGLADREEVDAVVLTGDIVNFPHNASIQFVLGALKLQRKADGQRMPLLYTAGNHDWLVEGLHQSRKEQRARFRRGVLGPLYSLRGAVRGPRRGGWSSLGGIGTEDCGVMELESAAVRAVGGQAKLLVIAVDNSMHEVSSAQAACVRRELARGLPTVLAVHVPFMLPGATPKNAKEVLCGDPRYTHDSDRGWHVERRERWPRSGSSASTLAFLEDLVHRFAAPRGPVLAVLGGHEHIHRADALGPGRPVAMECDDRVPPRCTGNGHRFGLPLHEGMVQYVTPAASEGGHRILNIRDARSPRLFASG